LGTQNYNPGPESGSAPPSVEVDIPASCSGLRLDQALARLLPEHSRSRIRTWIDAGRVSLAGSTVEATRRLDGGERIVVLPLADPRAAAFAPQSIPLAIVHEDAAIIVIDKPAGLVVHPGSGNWDGTLANALLHHAPELAQVPRAGIVHRLDKDTSGLLVVAKTTIAQTALVRQLQARSVHREYLALAVGDIARGGTIDAPIGRHPVKRTSMAVVATGKPSVTRYEVRERLGDCTLLACRLESGRTHQIRVHLASIGHPLVGDAAYGRTQGKGIAFARQALHAWKLGLLHPVTHESMQWESPLPADFAALLATLGQRRPATRVR
jgi:23S rRNA pseudouridine1911/1915/1917 synthase